MGGLFGVPNGFMGLDHLVTTIIQVNGVFPQVRAV